MWVEKGRVFGHQRGDGYVTPIPGAVRVEYLHVDDRRPVTEELLRTVILDTISAVDSLNRVKGIADKAKRAKALLGLLSRDPNDSVMAALVACGKDGVPVLDQILADEDRSRLHFVAVDSLRDIGDPLH